VEEKVADIKEDVKEADSVNVNVEMEMMRNLQVERELKLMSK
jgi:hypothetical protein